ncbi:MAG: 2-amino-4-hydroxy-6-hydroxymethyldihydropteridine diphosphokinase [Candidatus Eisenbacteria bacterium]|nr:2-amino-4-hydroxy-6-hydroxymethyldihydropteridine diphosphokinase [Candidatus Eisenbacteria bacterium]
MSRAWIGIGSNLGDRLGYIRRALGMMDGLPETALLRVSSVYDTEPVGVTDQPRFLNAVAELETQLAPEELLRKLLTIEDRCGRFRRDVWGPRSVDLDLLLYDGLEISTEELTVPHPWACERAFVLVPLAELEPGLVFPGDGESVSAKIARMGELGNRVRLEGGPPEPA